ncbi:MAG: hypothetical protein IV094_03690 [Vitreoscilla sp.]|nr:hypothetical protein [Vitreoscilla sp.]
MNFKEVEEFARAHWPAAFIAAIIVAPSIWTAAHLHFSERIAAMEQQIRILTDRSAQLEKKASDFEKKTVGLEATLGTLTARRAEEVREAGGSFDNLFTPSSTVKRVK